METDNPIPTASVAQLPQPSPSSTASIEVLRNEAKSRALATLAETQERLIPATNSQIIETLMPCLAQVAPTGMTQYDRDEWLTAAGMTLSEMHAPFDLIVRGCKAARHSATVDHPAKIVAAIIAEIVETLQSRKVDRSNAYAEVSRFDHEPEPVNDEPLDPAEVDSCNLLMRKLRLKTRYGADGQAFQLTEGMVDPCELLKAAA